MMKCLFLLSAVLVILTLTHKIEGELNYRKIKLKEISHILKNVDKSINKMNKSLIAYLDMDHNSYQRRKNPDKQLTFIKNRHDDTAIDVIKVFNLLREFKSESNELGKVKNRIEIDNKELDDMKWKAKLLKEKTRAVMEILDDSFVKKEKADLLIKLLLKFNYVHVEKNSK